jgi:hypothetical protein
MPKLPSLRRNILKSTATCRPGEVECLLSSLPHPPHLSLLSLSSSLSLSFSHTSSQSPSCLSGRSHAIFTLHLEVRKVQGSGSEQVNELRLARVNFVDLAGTDRQDSQVQVRSQEMMETQNINVSLSALGMSPPTPFSPSSPLRSSTRGCALRHG